MKSANPASRSEVVQTTSSIRIAKTSRTWLRVAAFLILVGLFAGSFYLTSSASSSNKVSNLDSIVKSEGRAKIVPDSFIHVNSAAPLFSFLPQTGPPTVTTTAGDCSTPKTLFNVQDLDLVVCAKVQNAAPGWQVIWSNANFVAVQTNTLTSGTEDVTFTLSTTSNLGDWRVIVFEPAGGDVQALTTFTVIDAENPTADLAVSKAALETSVASGAQAVFEVQVTNFGPSSATTVQLTDTVPANTTFSSFALLSGPEGFNCITPEAGGTGDTICTIASLARGETAVFLASYNVLSGLPSGTVITNTARVASVSEPPTADPRVFNDESSSSVTVLAGAPEACTLDCPDNVVVTADATQGGQPGAFVTFAAAAVSGNCGAVSNSPASGSFFTVGTHSIISSSEIGATSCTFTVTVLDSNPPTITCPANITVTAPEGETEANVSVGTPTINASGGGTVTAVRSDDVPATFDDNGNIVTPAIIHPVTDPYPIGSTGITWTVTDAGGRKASCTQIINVVAFGDRDPVTISCPAHVSVTASSGCEATISSGTIGTPTTNHTDNVTITPRRSDDLPLSDPFPAGITTITWTATDDLNGSVASCVQNVTVTPAGGADMTPPTLDVPPNVVTTTASCSAVLDDELGVATATDTGNCSNSNVNITRIGVPANFIFPTGTTTIIYTATDAAGNQSQGLQLVTVTEGPAVPPSISCPANITVFLPLNSTATSTVVNYTAPVGTDNCAGAVTTQTAGLPSGASFPVGTTTNTFRVTDASGNFVECSFTVTVLYNFTGFFAPVDNLPTLNVVNAGKAVPVKFSLSGNKGLNIFAPNSPFTVPINCDGSLPQDDIEETLNAGGSSLNYDSATDIYNYVWKTQNNWKNTCRQLVVVLNDGSEHRANFKFK